MGPPLAVTKCLFTCVAVQEIFLLYFNLYLAAVDCQGDQEHDVR